MRKTRQLAGFAFVVSLNQAHIVILIARIINNSKLTTMKKTLSFAGGKKDFTNELRKKVGEYFSSMNISPTGNIKLYAKTIILSLSLATIYYLLIFTPISFWFKAPLCIIFGLNIAGIGFNVMHDGGHGSYSKKKWVNKIMALSLNLLGGNAYFWNLKHNVVHHTFTNLLGHDEDIEIPGMRISPEQKKRWMHKYQHHWWYWAPFYSTTYLLWVFLSDLRKYIKGKIVERKLQKMSLWQHFVFWISKAVYFTLLAVIPLYFLPFPAWFIGFLITMLSCGFTLSVVFQLAHVVPDASFPVPNDSGELDEEWTVHQISTTTDFATDNKFISWFVGGLNFQIEHHLFPHISHVHYPAIRKIVMETCQKYGIKRVEYRTLPIALSAHVRHLKNMGK